MSYIKQAIEKGWKEPTDEELAEMYREQISYYEHASLVDIIMSDTSPEKWEETKERIMEFKAEKYLDEHEE